MHTLQFHYENSQWASPLPVNNKSQLVFVFGNRNLMESEFNKTLVTAFPNADLIGCSTSGEIKSTEIFDDSLVVSALEFEKTDIKIHSENVQNYEDFDQVLTALVSGIPLEGLKHLLVISDGQLVNGTALADGLSKLIPKNVVITGGLAGDDSRFEETVVWHNENVSSGLIILCGFYGEAIKIGHGSLGGWITFGPDRVITKSVDNVLYELDGQSALDLYKKYLGEFAAELPASALRFPLSVRAKGSTEAMVRTILSIDEETNSLTFAGDMPEGHYATLMRANSGKLIDGAEQAAHQSLIKLQGETPEFALLISCVGRRLVLQQETEFELESVQDVFSGKCILGGFYSYGELSPASDSNQCALHNQTMTITTFSELV